MISNKTVNYSIYDRSKGRPKFITDTTSVKRPSIETLTDTIKGAGIMGEIDLPSLAQIGTMEYEISFKRANPQAISLFSQKKQSIETRWVTDVLDNNSIKVEANKEIIEAIPKKLDLGTIETNSTNDSSVTLEILYYKLIIDGVALIEIDKLNNVFIINGIDYASSLRSIL